MPSWRMLAIWLVTSDRKPTTVVIAVITIGVPVLRSRCITTSAGVPPSSAAS